MKLEGREVKVPGTTMKWFGPAWDPRLQDPVTIFPNERGFAPVRSEVISSILSTTTWAVFSRLFRNRLNRATMNLAAASPPLRVWPTTKASAASRN